MDDYELFRMGSRFPHSRGFPGDLGDGNRSCQPVSGLVAGSNFGEHRIARLIHAGSSTSVYEVVGRFGGRRYALKTVSDPALPRAYDLECLRREREFASRLSHPSLQGIRGQGEVGAIPYFLMTLHSGENAEDLLKGREELQEAEGLIELAARFASVVDAVSALHRSGVVHRDIHPGNILLDAEGRLILTDYSSALNRADRNLRPDVEPAGDLLYRSPEQLPAGANHYAPAGDVYALGMTLYVLLTGEPPFFANSLREMGKLKLTRELPSSCRVNPAVPLGLDAIVRQACGIQRCARYPSAEDMARDLKRFVSRRRRCRNRYAP